MFSALLWDPALTAADVAGAVDVSGRSAARTAGMVRVGRVTAKDHPARGQLGVFATRRIPRGTRIMAFAGELLPDSAANSAYCTGIGGAHVVEPIVCGNEARFINDHLNVAAAPNVGSTCDVGTTSGTRRLMVQAVRDIAEGEEILTSYGGDYWATAAQSFPAQRASPPMDRIRHCTAVVYSTAGLAAQRRLHRFVRMRGVRVKKGRAVAARAFARGARIGAYAGVVRARGCGFRLRTRPDADAAPAPPGWSRSRSGHAGRPLVVADCGNEAAHMRLASAAGGANARVVQAEHGVTGEPVLYVEATAPIAPGADIVLSDAGFVCAGGSRAKRRRE